jgi:hypothetical protein
MKRTLASGFCAVTFGSALLVAGCASYYKVTDPTSGRVYYTDDVQIEKKGGTVKLKDARSKSVVTLQSSEVKEISKDEYKAGLAAPVIAPATAPAAAPAAGPATAPVATPVAEPAAAPAAGTESK